MKFIKGLMENNIINVNMVKSLYIGRTKVSKDKYNFYLYIELTEAVGNICNDDVVTIAESVTVDNTQQLLEINEKLNYILINALNTVSTVIDFNELFYEKAWAYLVNYIE